MQASKGLDNLSLMLPMITTLGEVEDALSFIHQAHEEVTQEGFDVKMNFLIKNSAKGNHAHRTLPNGEPKIKT